MYSLREVCQEFVPVGCTCRFSFTLHGLILGLILMSKSCLVFFAVLPVSSDSTAFLLVRVLV